MPHRGYIALWRKSLDSGVFQNEGLWKLWCLCLMKANHKECWLPIEGMVEPVQLFPGQFVTGRFSLHKEYYKKRKKGQKTPLTLWRWLQILEKVGNLNIKTNNKYSIITIINWDSYQNGKKQNEQLNEQQANNRRTTGEQQANTDNNVDNVDNEKKHTAFNNAEFYITKKKRKITGKRLETFMLFWEAFDYKRGKAEAADVWLDILTLTDKIVNEIIITAKAEAKRRPGLKANGEIPKMAQGWLSGKRWEDETEKQEIGNHKQPLTLKEIKKLNE